MFIRIALAASMFAAIAAAPALAAPKEFNYSWSAKDKFAWAQANYKAFCKIPMSRPVQFEDLPGWQQAGIAFATKDQIIGGIQEHCGEDLNTVKAAYRN